MEIKKTGGRGGKSRVPDRPICNKYTILLSSQHNKHLGLWWGEMEAERKKSCFLFLFFNLSCESCDSSYEKLKKPKETETEKGEKGEKGVSLGLVCVVVTWFMSALKLLALGV